MNAVNAQKAELAAQTRVHEAVCDSASGCLAAGLVGNVAGVDIFRLHHRTLLGPQDPWP